MIVKIQGMRDQREAINVELQSVGDEIIETNKAMKSTRKLLEAELKRQSVSALSDRTLLLVEELQEQEYRKLIVAVESDLNSRFKQLIRKDDFISSIHIVLDFTLHLIRNQKRTHITKGNYFEV